MSPDRLQQDLDYVVAAVRRHDTSLGVPAIYFLWAVLVPVGFALPYTWTITGLAIGVSLAWAGMSAVRAARHAA